MYQRLCTPSCYVLFYLFPGNSILAPLMYTSMRLARKSSSNTVLGIPLLPSGKASRWKFAMCASLLLLAQARQQKKELRLSRTSHMRHATAVLESVPLPVCCCCCCCCSSCCSCCVLADEAGTEAVDEMRMQLEPLSQGWLSWTCCSWRRESVYG